MKTVTLQYPKTINTQIWNVFSKSIRNVKKRSIFEPRVLVVSFYNKLDMNEIQDLANSLTSAYRIYLKGNGIQGPNKADERSLFYPYFVLHCNRLDYASGIMNDLQKIIDAGEIIAGQTEDGRIPSTNEDDKDDKKEEINFLKKYLKYIIGIIVILVLLFVIIKKK